MDILNFRWALGALGWLLLSSVNCPAWSAEGTLNTLSFKPLPTNASITVQPWDNSEENRNYAAKIEAYLKQKGHRIAQKADLILSFETKDVQGIWSEGARRHVLELEGDSGSHEGEKAKVRLNLYSSQQGGLLNKPANSARAKSDNAAPQIVLEFTLDLTKGRRLWQGQAAIAKGYANSQTLVQKMIPTLIDHMGRTVRRKSVNFQ